MIGLPPQGRNAILAPHFLSGTLYVVGTPIGNLQDVTLRALEVLRSVDRIAAEDTRRAARLLKRFEIERPVVSIHQHSTAAAVDRVVDALVSGGSVAYISEAGTPAVSDPGARLVQAARRAGVVVVAVPGPSALAAAWSIAGLDGSEFRFVGFLPASPKLRRRRLRKLVGLDVPLVVYEAPHRAARMLTDLINIFGDREIFLARELTKIHEESGWTTAGELQERFKNKAPKGEITLIVAPVP